MGARFAAVLDIDRERDGLARGGDERIRDRARDRPRPARTDSRASCADRSRRRSGGRRLRFARGFEIAVGEQHRRLGPVGLEPHAIGRQHVGTIEEIGDAAKPLRLALRAIGRARAIEAHQLGVGRRIEPGLDRERERPLGGFGSTNSRRARFEIGRLERLAVESAETSTSSSPSSVSGAPSPPAGLGRIDRVETTRVAWTRAIRRARRGR